MKERVVSDKVAVSSLQPQITKKKRQFLVTTEDHVATGEKMNSRKFAAGVLRILRPLLTCMNVRVRLSISLTKHISIKISEYEHGCEYEFDGASE